MTDEKLKQGQDLKRIIGQLESEIDKFNNVVNPAGFNVFLPNVGTLIDDIKRVFQKHLNEYNDKFRKL